MISRLVFVFQLCMWFSVYAAEISGEQLFKQVKDRVFKIKNSLSLDSEKASYGSGFPVREDGLVVTNYHVVASALERDEKYKIVVVIGEKNYEARILNFDTTHDLALLKIDHHFSSIINLSKSEPAKGETIYSLGYPKDLDITIVDGIFNGAEVNGRYKNYHISAPINSGMSGGPAFNQKAELIGVNVSHMLGAQNISFLVPSHFINDLMKGSLVSDKSYLDNDELVEDKITSDLLTTQQGLTDDFKAKSVKGKLDDLTFIKGPDTLKCWERDDSDKKRKKYEGLKAFCYLSISSYIRPGTYSGSYALTYEFYKSDKLNQMTFYSLLEDKFKSKIDISKLLFSFSEDKYRTDYSCDHDFVISKQKVPFKITYCMNGYVYLKGIYDMDLRAVSLLKDKKGVVIKLKMSGFTPENINIFIMEILNGLRINES